MLSWNTLVGRQAGAQASKGPLACGLAEKNLRFVLQGHERKQVVSYSWKFSTVYHPVNPSKFFLISFNSL